MRITRSSPAIGASALSVLLCACASQAPTTTTAASDTAMPELACAFAGNCVDSLGTGGLGPLRYTGTPAQAQAALLATLGSFAEARVVRSQPLAMEVIFTTPLGFRDQVDFLVDAQAQRIHFRSRSLFGLFDFGKNRSRMQAVAARFEQQGLR